MSFLRTQLYLLPSLVFFSLWLEERGIRKKILEELRRIRLFHLGGGSRMCCHDKKTLFLENVVQVDSLWAGLGRRSYGLDLCCESLPLPFPLARDQAWQTPKWRLPPLYLQGLQSVRRRGHAGTASRPHQGGDRTDSGREETGWANPKLHPGPQAANRGLGESEISFLPTPQRWSVFAVGFVMLREFLQVKRYEASGISRSCVICFNVVLYESYLHHLHL